LKNKDETVEDPDCEEAGSDEDDQNEKEEIIDKSKALKNYEYEELTEVVLSFEVSNFKTNEIPGYGKGKVNIEKIKEGGNELVIFRNPAKLIMFQGLLVKKLTNADYMKGKDDALYIVSYTMESGADGAKKTTRNNCKMAVSCFFI
jgi:flagellar hook protein FlgE